MSWYMSVCIAPSCIVRTSKPAGAPARAGARSRSPLAACDGTSRAYTSVMRALACQLALGATRASTRRPAAQTRQHGPPARGRDRLIWTPWNLAAGEDRRGNFLGQPVAQAREPRAPEVRCDLGRSRALIVRIRSYVVDQPGLGQLEREAARGAAERAGQRTGGDRAQRAVAHEPFERSDAAVEQRAAVRMRQPDAMSAALQLLGRRLEVWRARAERRLEQQPAAVAETEGGELVGGGLVHARRRGIRE